MTTVMIADDSGALRERLVALCGELGGLEVVGQARDCHDALTSVEALRPAVVVLGSTLFAVLPRLAQGEPGGRPRRQSGTEKPDGW